MLYRQIVPSLELYVFTATSKYTCKQHRLFFVVVASVAHAGMDLGRPCSLTDTSVRVSVLDTESKLSY